MSAAPLDRGGSTRRDAEGLPPVRETVVLKLDVRARDRPPGSPSRAIHGPVELRSVRHPYRCASAPDSHRVPHMPEAIVSLSAAQADVRGFERQPARWRVRGIRRGERPAHRMVVMTTDDDELTAISGWTDDEIRAGRRPRRRRAVRRRRARGAQAHRARRAPQRAQPAEDAERSAPATASNLLHVFWDEGYKRMPAKRRAALLARVSAAPAATTTPSPTTRSPTCRGRCVSAIADGSAERSRRPPPRCARTSPSTPTRHDHGRRARAARHDRRASPRCCRTSSCAPPSAAPRTCGSSSSASSAEYGGGPDVDAPARPRDVTAR